ncbi:hypothetical protein [Pelagibius sp.]|uniref:hypothetical protein n=1 Tax=Pelagibius sp. TaxID=1931238 RepID=UPI00261ADAE0|nr:hypothetical protein [Pelagibius sp.]
MTLPSYATYAVVPLHLAAGFLFALVPASVYHQSYYPVFGAIVLTLLVTVVVYGYTVWQLQPGFAVLWFQFLLVLLAVAVPFFTVDFGDAWTAIVYLPIMGGSALACLLVGHALRFMA